MEKSARSWKMLICVLIGIGSVSVGLQAYSVFLKPNEVRAAAFILENGEGKAYAVLGLTKGASPSLIFYDEFDQRRQNGNARMSVGLLADGSPELAMSGGDGKMRVGMRVDSGGSAKLECKDSKGNTAWKAPE